MNPWCLDLQLAGTTLDSPLSAATVAHNQGMTVFVSFALIAANIFIYFSL